MRQKPYNLCRENVLNHHARAEDVKSRDWMVAPGPLGRSPCMNAWARQTLRLLNNYYIYYQTMPTQRYLQVLRRNN